MLEELRYLPKPTEQIVAETEEIIGAFHNPLKGKLIDFIELVRSDPKYDMFAITYAQHNEDKSKLIMIDMLRNLKGMSTQKVFRDSWDITRELMPQAHFYFNTHGRAFEGYFSSSSLTKLPTFRAVKSSTIKIIELGNTR